jgi:hypothetical protein
MQRSSRAAWESEMLCLRPSLENAVFADFDPMLHVKPAEYNPNLPLYRAIDFGFINPFVCLWIQVDADGIVRVIDEYIRSRATIDAHASAIINWMGGTALPVLGYGRGLQSVGAGLAPARLFLNQHRATSNQQPIVTYCDPAGSGVNDVNGSSAVRELRKLGINCRYRKSSILEGIELIRRALRDGSGKTSLTISPRCAKLIESLRCYHYPDTTIAELPYKDGLYDHPIDALRYFFVNRFGPSSKIIEVRY